jgi:hypothetical protein
VGRQSGGGSSPSCDLILLNNAGFGLIGAVEDAPGTSRKQESRLLDEGKQTIKKGRGSSESDPLRAILRFGHVVGGAINPVSSEFHKSIPRHRSICSSNQAVAFRTGRRNIRARPRPHITDRSKARRTPSECRAIHHACPQKM